MRIRKWAWGLAIPAVATAVAGQLGLAGPAAATRTGPGAPHLAGTIAPAKVNNLDCNRWSRRYTAANPGMKPFCTDPIRRYENHRVRFYDNGHYVGHDEPSVKFISSIAGSGNTMTYDMRLPKDPKKPPTASASVTDYEELSIAPWFGLPICDPKSFPQNPCTPDSDTNTGAGSPADAGSAFMELQFYPPGWAPFLNLGSCSATKYCSALNIDSLECEAGGSCNNNCIEPVNFSFLQTNGVPPGPPAPQDPQTFRYAGPFTAGGKSYAQVQFETDIGASEALCNVSSGTGCTAKPAGAEFYPFWSINNTQRIRRLVRRRGVCIWNFGNDIAGLTRHDFGKDKQYGTPDVARFGGTLASKVLSNPALARGCRAPSRKGR